MRPITIEKHGISVRIEQIEGVKGLDGTEKFESVTKIINTAKQLIEERYAKSTERVEAITLVEAEAETV
jgi:hypothetical protein